MVNTLLESELLSSNCSEISTYEKIHFGLNNVHNILGILLKKNL